MRPTNYLIAVVAAVSVLLGGCAGTPAREHGVTRAQAIAVLGR